MLPLVVRRSVRNPSYWATLAAPRVHPEERVVADQAAVFTAANFCAINRPMLPLDFPRVKRRGSSIWGLKPAVAAALIDRLESSEEAAISEAWRTELLKPRDGPRPGHTSVQP